MITSLDTLKLKLNNYSVLPSAKLLTNQTIDFNGECISQKQYLNTPIFNLNLSNDKGCFVQTSVPKIVYENNEKPVNKKQFNDALNVIQNKLFDVGIKTDINNADLSRIDIFRGVKTRYTFDEYSQVFNYLQGKRQSKRDYGSTYLFENTQRELCFYDKEVEQKIKNGENNIMPSNNVRGEARLLNKRAISTTGLVTAKDLLNDYGVINDIYLKNVKNVFRVKDLDNDGQLEMPIICQNEVEKKLIEYKAQINKKFDFKFIKSFALMYGVLSIANLMSIDSFINTCLRITDNKNTRDLKRHLQKLFADHTLGQKAIPSRVKNLYDELYYKFAV